MPRPALIGRRGPMSARAEVGRPCFLPADLLMNGFLANMVKVNTYSMANHFVVYTV